MKPENKNKKSAFPIVLGIIWGILLALTAWVIIYVMTYENDINKNASTIANYVTEEQYGMVYRDVKYRMADGMTAENHPEYSELVGIAHYLEAAAQYRMYIEGGQPEKAKYYYDKMQNAVQELGDLKSIAYEIENYVID